MKNILVAIDFSDEGDVVDRAAELAAALDAELQLLHVAAPNPDFVGYEAGPQVVRDQRADHLKQERQNLESLVASLAAREQKATGHIVEGPTAKTILAEAARRDSELIVVGSHGHGALYRAVLGSVSAGVVEKSTIPVLIVPTRRAE